MEPEQADTTNVLSTAPRQLYVRRWFIIVSIALLNTSNALIWNSFATVAATTAQYYDVDFFEVNMFSLVYMIISIPVGFFAIWSLDYLGLRLSLTASATLNVTGAVMRLFSSFDFVSPGIRYPLGLAGQCVAASSQTFIMFCPPKVAQFWFPESQRAIANTIASMANPLGILLSAVLSPAILRSDPNNMMYLMIAYTAPAVVAFFATVLSLTSSKPMTPPSDSAEQCSEPFLEGVKKIFRNKNFVILMLCFGSGMGIFTALAALIMQILCPYGYDEAYSGMAIGILVGFGIVGAAISGFIADYTKKFVEVSKVALCLAASFFCLFSAVAVFPQQYVPVAVCIGLFGFFGFGQYAISLELAVETTFPVAEATPTGLMVICGQIQSAILVLVMQNIGYNVEDKYGTCSPNVTQGANVQSYSYGNILLGSLCCLAGTALVCFYDCPYKRLEFERKRDASVNQTPPPPYDSESMK